MKRYIHASTDINNAAGFVFNFGNKELFYISDSKVITDKVVRAVINKVCDIRGIDSDSKIRQSALYDKRALADFRKRIQHAQLVKHDTGKIIYYTISGKNFSWSFPEADFEHDVLVF